MRLELRSGHDERLTWSTTADGLLLTLKGSADADFLGDLLDRVHAEMLARRYAGVTLDLSQLVPLDPAAVKSLIKWAMRQAELEAAERYRLALRYSEGVGWQKVSLSAIGHLCPYVRMEPLP